MYSRGMGDSNINPTTIWTPSTGFLNQPGTLSSGYQFKPQVTSVYDVPGLLLSAPDCTQAAGGAFVSSGCVDQALAVQQQNFQRTAAYNAGTLQLPAAPPPPPPPPPAKTPVAAPPVPSPASAPISSPAPAGSGQSTNYVPLTQQAAAVLGGNVDVVGFNLPIWGIAAAAAGLLFFMGRR